MIPHFKIKTDKLPANAAGQQIWFIIKLRPSVYTNNALILHELEHVKQWWISTLLAFALTGSLVWFIPPFWPLLFNCPFVHGLLYTFSAKYRLWAELAAHRVQYQAGENKHVLAKNLSGAYGLKLSYSEAWDLIGTKK